MTPPPRSVARLSAGWSRLVSDDLAIAELDAPPLSLDAHRAIYGSLPPRPPLATAEHIVGRGGAGFPLARKLAAVASQRGPRVVVANGAESEPGARKDKALLTHAPHLVLDGLGLATRLLEAREAIVAVEDATAADVLERAIRERSDAVRVALLDRSYLTGQETALLAALEGRPALPRFQLARVAERGYKSRPTLVANVETLAQWALAARFGTSWHQSAGTRGHDRSTRIVSIALPGSTPTVVELAPGATVRSLLDAVGVTTGLALVGGLFGELISVADERAMARVLVDRADSSDELALGAGSVLLAPSATCVVCATSELVGYLSEERAGQCGPCDRGLPELARALGAGARPAELATVARLIARRGACALPDAAAHLATAITPADAAGHQRRRCHERPFALESREPSRG
ncbi:Respiratory-chain NADH dehydrogenase domain 51 kDa subunit [Acidimicrobium ferrooxidans DSM 10331]|uniref:Respiratory-chain NADH dehydrogenase domain 51 kDa subunit n=1 Tax=Acidimicrobium ferrooxidans (strain DSM 10331 / JCM 15462 / NBRC 103882 / ICP) TaxID=525909 RepID=C7LYX8_ACIFD|nr:Respiratory-chain NADH dehydrogenase domain 51 kDa subunit [Acidimicrobium ferrooxidans DSM 10331]